MISDSDYASFILDLTQKERYSGCLNLKNEACRKIFCRYISFEIRREFGVDYRAKKFGAIAEKYIEKGNSGIEGLLDGKIRKKK